jgi:hypothetical protein
MGIAESEQKGGHLLVTSAEKYTASNEGVLTSGSIVTLDIPSNFDFGKRGKELLRRIESACRLFSEEGDG